MKSWLFALSLLFPVFLLSTPSFADAPEAFLMATKVKVKVKNDDGSKFKLEVTRQISQGQRIVLGGDDRITVEASYEPMGENLAMRFFVLNSERTPISTGMVVIGQNDGAKLEVGEFFIEFWDVTKKRAEKEARRAAERAKNAKETGGD